MDKVIAEHKIEFCTGCDICLEILEKHDQELYLYEQN